MRKALGARSWCVLEGCRSGLLLKFWGVQLNEVEGKGMGTTIWRRTLRWGFLHQ